MFLNSTSNQVHTSSCSADRLAGLSQQTNSNTNGPAAKKPRASHEVSRDTVAPFQVQDEGTGFVMEDRNSLFRNTAKSNDWSLSLSDADSLPAPERKPSIVEYDSGEIGEGMFTGAEPFIPPPSADIARITPKIMHSMLDEVVVLSHMTSMQTVLAPGMHESAFRCAKVVDTILKHLQMSFLT
jgi:hypothetical protein